MLRGTRRFSGAPMPKHMALPGLTPDLFRRWLMLFGQTTDELGNPNLKRDADARAALIAERFWQRYQVEGYDARLCRSNVAQEIDQDTATSIWQT